MLASLSLIFIVGLAMGAICQKLKLPRIIGILVTGIVLGPYVLDLLDPSILSISAELRKMALIIILLKAGLSLDLKDLNFPFYWYQWKDGWKEKFPYQDCLRWSLWLV